MSFPYLHKNFSLAPVSLRIKAKVLTMSDPHPNVCWSSCVTTLHSLSSHQLLQAAQCFSKAQDTLLPQGLCTCWSLCLKSFPLTYPHGLLLQHLGSFLKFSARPSLTSSGKTSALPTLQPAILSLWFIFLWSTYYYWTYYICDWLVDLPPLKTWASWGEELLSVLST